MSNAQFYFALGVPFFSLLLIYIASMISNRSAIGDLGKRIDDLGKRIDDLGKRIDDLATYNRNSIDELGKRIDNLRTDLSGRMDRLEIRMDRMEQKLDLIGTEVHVNHEHRLSVLEAQVLGRTG